MRNTHAALKWIVGILEEKGIPYQISGGYAAKLYGSMRPLNDIDIDIPEKDLESIIENVQPYIVSRLQRYRDEKWDLDCMTINYQGQEIDIGGAYTTKITNKERIIWIPLITDFSKIKRIKVEDIEVSVISPEDLIEYKKELDGEHQLEDISAITEYIKNIDDYGKT